MENKKIQIFKEYNIEIYVTDIGNIVRTKDIPANVLCNVIGACKLELKYIASPEFRAKYPDRNDLKFKKKGSKVLIKRKNKSNPRGE